MDECIYMYVPAVATKAKYNVGEVNVSLGVSVFVPSILQVRGGRIPSPETNYAGGWTRSVVAL